MAYAALSDLLAVGMPAQALGSLSPLQVATALQSASDKLDSYFRGRYGNGPSPLLLTWDTEVTKAVAKMASYELLGLRGVKPDKPRPFAAENADAVQWCRDVQRQQAHPLVTVAAAPLAGSVQPNLVSSSVINLATGARGPNRGW